MSLWTDESSLRLHYAGDLLLKKNVLLKAAEAKISGQASKRAGSSRGGADVLQASQCQCAIMKECMHNAFSLISFA